MSNHEVLELMKPRRGLCDAGDRWSHTLRHHHVEDLNMSSLSGEPALFTAMLQRRLIGLSGLYYTIPYIVHNLHIMYIVVLYVSLEEIVY